MRQYSLTILSLLLHAACSGPNSASLLDVEGQTHTPLDVVGDDVHVVIFLSHECPIANSYAATIQELHQQWIKEPRLHLYLVHVCPDLSAASAQKHASDYALPGRVLLDPTHRLARLVGASVTPEAVVCTSDGIGYRGRIDDQWRALGTRAPSARQHDLADAVERILVGKPVERPHPRAVGCPLPEL